MQAENKLPLIRSGERKDFKRCVKRWYWSWRRGLVSKEIKFGALDLGTWVHAALAEWYGSGYKRNGLLSDHFFSYAQAATIEANNAGAPDHILDTAEELLGLGEAMVTAYQDYWENDPGLNVIGAEIPLEFTIPDSSGKVIAKHRLKPDLVYSSREDPRDIWLLETKTAGQIRTEHLVIDDQARPYGAMAERALRQLGLMKKGQKFRGIMYNYLRKGLPDMRECNSKGQYLNKNGTVSKRQPPPLFVRKPIFLSNRAKAITLRRIQQETVDITLVTLKLRVGNIKPQNLPKTPDVSCPRQCPFFAMCVAEEEGTNIRDMERTMFYRRNPYEYEEDRTESIGFGVG